MSVNTLENEVIKLRAPEPSDLDLLYTWENKMEIWTVSNTLTPFSRFLLKKYIETSHLDLWEAKQLRFIIEVKEQKNQSQFPVGLVDLFDFDPFHLRAGVGILIAAQEHKKKGYATEALRVLIDYCFHTLQLHQLWANVATTNKVSLQLFTKMGFTIVGTKKEWLKTLNGWSDEVMLQHINPYINAKKG